MADSIRTAGDLRRAREEFLAGGGAHTGVVTPDVLSSWRRSQALDVHPDRVELPFVREPDPETPLLAAATPVLRRVASDLAAQAVSVILTSADGVVLDRVVSDPAILRALDEVRLVRGYSYAEEFAGTNGIGTTLETGTPTFIRGSEHYVGTLDRLACAGSPIRDPVTGRVLGVVDLTCWARQSDPLLFVLAKSAGSQIEDRLTALRNESETALLDSYLKHTRRYPGGVLAIGGDVVLMNPYLRRTLDAGDQSTLLDHAAEMAHSADPSTAIMTLPTGVSVKMTVAESITARNAQRSAVLHVHLNNHFAIAGRGSAEAIPRLAGRSSSWLRSCQQVDRCCRDRDWVVIEGERGSGRARLGQAVAQHVNPSRTVRVLRAEDFSTTDAVIAEVEAETDGDDFAVIIANVDALPDESLDPLAAVLQTRAGRGWVAATMGTEQRSPMVDALLLPFFTHTVTVPALRHRIEDLEQLVPALLRELTRGADVQLAPEAMRQLAKLPWPGNVAQLRKVLAETVAVQRSGTIGIDKLPAECRSLARRRLTRMEALERDAIVRSLQENCGSKAIAAEALGMSRATIYRKIKEFGIA
ncbi:helix-turn-helix domain-containing protein [Mycolicibacterium sp. 120266]|uniref:sigma-54-dependent Fis family transcriptional regulator n=1 Tax=Mycolicibacterium sp. 120266 TaxID=3090601 RepID=UPI00299E0193|nr:GAF domain-containing protein [Mycolicibacterium sp. 120266]MDX1873800.1 helix-turn-helix domain-containing protein [Mycolicibacterium sp. 120266]